MQVVTPSLSVQLELRAGFTNNGDGGDTLTIQTGTYSAIGGGAGLDTIEFSGATLATGAGIKAGAGNDVISGGCCLWTRNWSQASRRRWC